MPTAQEIANALAGRDGPVVLRPRLEERTVTFGLLRDLTPALLEAQVSIDNDQAVLWRASLELRPEELPADFDRATALVSLRLEVLVDGAFESFALGLYALTRPRRSLRSGGLETWQVSADGIEVRLVDQTTTAPYTIATGSVYTTEIEAILDLLSLNHSIPGLGSTTPSAFSWGPATPWREILDQLTEGINHYPVFPNASGTFTTRARIDPSAEIPAVSYSTEIEPRMLAEPFDADENVGTFPNDVVVLVDDPNRPAFFERRQNSDPASPISIPRTGRNVLERVVGDRVLDQTTAGSVADFLVRDAAARAEGATLRSLLDPRRGPRETYLVRIDTREVDTLWRVMGWRTTLRQGAIMEHRIARARAIAVTEP